MSDRQGILISLLKRWKITSGLCRKDRKEFWFRFFLRKYI